MFPPKMSSLLYWTVAAWISTFFILAPFAPRRNCGSVRTSARVLPTSRIAPNVNPSPREPNRPVHAAAILLGIDLDTARPAFNHTAQAFFHLDCLSLNLAARSPPHPYNF